MSKTVGILSKLLVFVFLGIVIVAILFSSSAKTSAEVKDHSNEYVINNYQVTATYKQDNTVEITEKIKVHFYVSKHGIYRALPEVNQVNSPDKNFNKTLRNVYYMKSANTEYLTESEGNVFYIRLGSETQTYSAGSEKEFVINYVAKLDSRYTEIDRFYYNILGHMWDTTVQSFSAVVNFEKPIANPNTKIYFGKTTSQAELSTFSWATNTQLTVWTTAPLYFGEGITVQVDLPVGYAKVSNLHTSNIVALVGVVLSALALVLIFVKFSNRKKITPVVQFSLDKKYTPADVGYIIDKKVNNCDVASLIVYWAEKGFLTIEEREKKTFLKLTDKEFSGKLYEKQMFFEIFEHMKPGEEINIKEIAPKMCGSVIATKKGIQLENAEMFSQKAIGWRTFIIIFVGIVLGVALWSANYFQVNDGMQIVSVLVALATIGFLFVVASNADKQQIISNKKRWANWAFGLLFLAGLLVFAICSFKPDCDVLGTVFWAFGLVFATTVLLARFNVRTDAGCRELGDIIGLKNFIEVAEKQRLEMLVKDDPKAFYKVLPYAYVLGVYDEWCKKFEDIAIEAPSFYSSDEDAVFTVLAFSSLMRVTNTSILSAFTKANMENTMSNLNTSSGKFSGGGGGFSGGGIGGGGGGSW